MATVSKRLYEFGGRVSQIGANVAGHPAAIVAVTVFCAIWLLVTGEDGQNSLTLILSILAITLTQMVLNQQRTSERALHLKLDELVFATSEARDEMVAIENQSEAEIERLRRPVGTAA
jgi:low affinity Fe/Cu permease